MKGIDISSWQDSLDLSKIKTDFVILRGGFTGYVSLNQNKDSSFEKFYKQAKQLNIPVGCYYYSCCNSYETGLKESKWFYENCLKGKQFEFPVYIDVEDKHNQLNNKKGVTDGIIAFGDYLEKQGFYFGVYGSDISGFKDMMDINRLERFDKWVARYGSKPRYVLTYGLWQDSSTGKLNGYSGNLDTDESFKNYPKIIKQAKLNGFGDYQEKPIETHPSSIFYVVKSGDTLSSIAKKFNTTWQKIYQDNKNIIKNPNLIYPNQRLIIKR